MGRPNVQHDPLALRKDGGNSPTADIPFGSHKITGLADGSSAQDAAAFHQAGGGGGGGGNSAAVASGCLVFNTGTPSISGSNAVNIIAFGSSDFDTDAYHSNSVNNSRITVPTGLDGKFTFYGRVGWPQSTAILKTRLLKNGSAYMEGPITQANNTASGDGTIGIFGPVNAVAGDYFEFAVLQNSGGSLSLPTGTLATCYFGCVRESGGAPWTPAIGSAQNLLTLDGYSATPAVRTVVGTTATTLGTFSGTQETNSTFKYRQNARTIRWKGKAYAWCANEIRVRNDSSTNWDTAYTIAHTNDTAHNMSHTGLEVAVISGVATLIGLYFDATNGFWYGIKSVDGSSWSEISLTYTGGGSPDFTICGAGDQIMFNNIFYMALGSGDYALSWDPSGSTLNKNSNHLSGAITGTAFLAYKGRLFMLYNNSSNTYAIDELVGTVWTTRFTYPESSDSSNTNLFSVGVLFCDGTANTLYSITSNQNGGTCHWVCHALTLGVGTVSDGGDISAATLPSGIRNQTSAGDVGKFIAFVDRITARTTTSILLVNANGGGGSTTTTSYQWNGSASLITQTDTGGVIANWWPSPHYASGERVYTVGQNDIVLCTTAQVAVAGGVQISFKLYQQPGQSAVTGVPMALYYTQDGVTLVQATLSNPSAGSLAGKSVTGLVADGTTTYTVIWNSTTDGFAQSAQAVLIAGIPSVLSAPVQILATTVSTPSSNDPILDCPSFLAYYSGGSGLYTDSAGTAPVSADGDAVRYWKDKGQYKIHIKTTGTASTYKLNKGPNNLPGVLFATSYLTSIKEAACGGPDFCVVACIARPWTVTGFKGIFANNAPFGSTTGNGIYANTNGASGFETQGWGVWGNGYAGNCIATGPHGIGVDNTFVIATFLAGRNSDVRKNGVSVTNAQQKGSLIASPYGVFNVGADSTSDGPTYFDGYILDFVVLAGTVGPKQIEGVEDALGTRHGISITHP